jgi:phosphosulfolactate synthase (CoM biosynthesis protein A)
MESSSAIAAGPRAFGDVRINDRSGKPRQVGITEIRGPYYTPMGPRYLEDVLDTMGVYVDALKVRGRLVRADAAYDGSASH